ncbi:hypothetical protein OM076_31065 [Solirubrobacter ginsenosidimutans]|uniref:DUF2142 domain-containing protein n=1 Tax=Solirubrobacter ginsenosidimutans TaxID=490573 RepID=A0A9X3N0H7_9ACTN|nr:DUF2142 domain-containing protein [Solirubrobacter ginsenosidimutans]MDA0164750.1 hypothetical protein [Solirubrobacter ginsenosidimutans]
MRRFRRVPAALLVLLAVAALESLSWGVLVPALQGPDESSHLTVVSRIADHGRLLPGDADQGLSRELLVTASEAGFGPLVGNLGARPYWSRIDQARWRLAEQRLGGQATALVADPQEGPPVRGANRNPPLYYALLAIPWKLSSGSFIDRVHLIRLVNVPIFLLAVAATWSLARTLLPGTPWAPPLAAGIVALWPQLAFLSGTVDPDILLVALFSAFMAVAARILDRGTSRGRVAALCGLALAASATHARGVVLLAAAAIVLILAVSSGRDRSPRRLAALAAGLTIGSVAALVALTRLTQTTLTGASTARGISDPFELRQFVSYVWQFYLPRLGFMDPSIGGDYGVQQAWIRTFVGTFGSLEIEYPGWVYRGLDVLAVAVLAGFVVALVRYRDVLRGRIRVVAALTALALATIGSLHLVAYRTLLIDRTDPIVVGRHLLPLIALVAIAVAAAGRALPRHWGRAYAGVVLGTLVALQLGGLGLTLARFYA